MLPLVEKNSQSSQEGTHLQLKNEELMKEFQLFLEQEQRTPMGKLAEIKVRPIARVSTKTSTRFSGWATNASSSGC